MYNLTEHDYQILMNILREVVPNCEIRIFGSRHKGSSKPYSDIDLAVLGLVGIEQEDNLREALVNSEITVRVDVLNWDTISDAFKSIIETDYSIITL